MDAMPNRKRIAKQNMNSPRNSGDLYSMALFRIHSEESVAARCLCSPHPYGLNIVATAQATPSPAYRTKPCHVPQLIPRIAINGNSTATPGCKFTHKTTRKGSSHTVQVGDS